MAVNFPLFEQPAPIEQTPMILVFFVSSQAQWPMGSRGFI
jgi:hypothetical protein